MQEKVAYKKLDPVGENLNDWSEISRIILHIIAKGLGFFNSVKTRDDF